MQTIERDGASNVVKHEGDVDGKAYDAGEDGYWEAEPPTLSSKGCFVEFIAAASSFALKMFCDMGGKEVDSEAED